MYCNICKKSDTANKFYGGECGHLICSSCFDLMKASDCLIISDHKFVSRLRPTENLIRPVIKEEVIEPNNYMQNRPVFGQKRSYYEAFN